MKWAIKGAFNLLIKTLLVIALMFSGSYLYESLKIKEGIYMTITGLSLFIIEITKRIKKKIKEAISETKKHKDIINGK